MVYVEGIGLSNPLVIIQKGIHPDSERTEQMRLLDALTEIPQYTAQMRRAVTEYEADKVPPTHTRSYPIRNEDSTKEVIVYVQGERAPSRPRRNRHKKIRNM